MSNKDQQPIQTDPQEKPPKKTDAQELVLVSEVLPDRIPIMPVYPRPVFPHFMMPLTFSGEKFLEIIHTAIESHNSLLGLVLISKLNEQSYINSDLYTVGTVTRIYRCSEVVEGSVQIVVQGLQRFKKVRVTTRDPILLWEVRYNYKDKAKTVEKLKPHILAIMASAKELLSVNPLLQEQLKTLLQQVSYERPHMLVDLLSSILTAEPTKLQDLLETFDMLKRCEKLLLLLKQEIEVSQMQAKIHEQIGEEVGRQQKEYFLREQLKAIKKELGLEKDDKTQEIEKFEERLKNLTLPREALDVIREEIDKINMLDTHSPEYHVARNYLNELTLLPWGLYSKDNLNIKRARKILNSDHYGLDDVKERILEFISTIIKKGSVSGSIICLQGPPGVGKTSVGRSIANALGRKFYRFSVGGMRDEAEIKGHRRTYIGAMPGKIIRGLKQTKTSNPVIMIDEIDKIGISFQGDPASALLEVLDPEQNRDFLDHYLDVRFDLSKILFVTTANQLDTIPRPLLDRMEVINLPGYIMQEKIKIAQQFLLPKQTHEHGLTVNEVSVRVQALRTIIDRYAREAGVRGLENQIKKIMRKVTLRHAEGEKTRIVITAADIEAYLGKPAFTTEELYRRAQIGVALGLAWTALGGATLYIEASSVATKTATFKQTGQLGEVMQESSEIAYSYVRSILEKKEPGFFNDHTIHLHVPTGATPKDGPSAGITMAVALYSLATNRPVRAGVAMTGELTLTGRVLAIGGVREKTIAARRVNIRELILPHENRNDFDALPEYLREGITAHFANYFDDVLTIIYGRRNTRKISTKSV
jgi:ATP-dependent Lon protease